MKTHLKLACFVLLGLVVSGVVFVFLSLMISITCPRMKESEGFPILGFIILSPLSFIVGSLVTGFLSCPILKSKWMLFLLAPALYFSICLIFTIPSAKELIDFLLGTSYWYVFSLAGVAIGFWIRILIKRRIHPV
jgi:hypothetical protein